MKFKLLAAAICLTVLGDATPSKAQQRSESQIEPILQQLPSQIEQLTDPSQLQQLQQLLQQQEPLLYLFLQLQQSQPEDLQQKAEEQLLQILQEPPPLQQQLIFNQ